MDELVLIVKKFILDSIGIVLSIILFIGYGIGYLIMILMPTRKLKVFVGESCLKLFSGLDSFIDKILSH